MSDMSKCKELEDRLNKREDLLQEIYQMWWPLWEKAGLDDDHPLFQAVLDRIQEIDNEHDDKYLQQILRMQDVGYKKGFGKFSVSKNNDGLNDQNLVWHEVGGKIGSSEEFDEYCKIIDDNRISSHDINITAGKNSGSNLMSLNEWDCGNDKLAKHIISKKKD